MLEELLILEIHGRGGVDLVICDLVFQIRTKTVNVVQVT